MTGGSGFFGGVLKRRLLAEGFAVTNIDLVRDEDSDAGADEYSGGYSRCGVAGADVCGA